MGSEIVTRSPAIFAVTTVPISSGRGSWGNQVRVT